MNYNKTPKRDARHLINASYHDETFSKDWSPNKRKTLPVNNLHYPNQDLGHASTVNVPTAMTSPNEKIAPREKRGFMDFKFGTRAQQQQSPNVTGPVAIAPVLYSAQIDKRYQLAETREFILNDKASMILAVGDRISTELANSEFIVRIISRSQNPSTPLHYIDINYMDYQKLGCYEGEINENMKKRFAGTVFRSESISIYTSRRSSDIYINIQDRHKTMTMNTWVFAKLIGLSNEIQREYESFVKKIDNAKIRMKIADNFIAYMLNDENINDNIELPIINTKGEIRSFEATRRTLETLWKQLGKMAYNK